MQQTTKRMLTIVGASLVLGLSGCTTSQYDPNVYQGSQANQPVGYHTGYVESVRPVTIQDDTTGVGAGAGAVVGGIAGSGLGGGSGRYVGGVLGALTFGIIGNSIESNTSSKTNAQEILVSLKDGREMIIVQENTQDLKVGEKVKLIAVNGNFRVVRY
tara:strand:+ start:482 stop:955 length:474 start_codon:yes stop_codon:yes gene_type:complete